MAQHDYVIDNQSGLAFRQDLNNALAAIVSINSGASAPSTTYAYQWWADTTAGLLKLRNAANNAWITIGTLDDANLGLLNLAGGTLTGALLADDAGTAALPAIAFDGDPNTGIFRAGADQLGIATNGVERVEFGTTEVVFNDGGADIDFRIEGDTNPNLFKIDAGLDEVQVANLNGGPIAGSRNRIINGDMRIDQRNAGASVTPAPDAYTLDRWYVYELTDGTVTVQRVAEAPAAFTNSLKVTVTATDASLAAAQLTTVEHFIEGFNTAGLGFGSANASSVTISFWVRSSVAGLFSGCLRNGDSTRSYPFSYSINAVNTWEQKTVTIAGDTTGTWGSGNGKGLTLTLSLGSGSSFSGTAGAWTGADYRAVTGAVNLLATASATWQITGVQLEPGSVATPFERRSYGQELALCQRYFCSIDGNSTLPVSTNAAQERGFIKFPMTMRAVPTLVFAYASGTGATWITGTDGAYQSANHSTTTSFSVTAAIEL